MENSFRRKPEDRKIPTLEEQGLVDYNGKIITKKEYQEEMVERENEDKNNQ